MTSEDTSADVVARLEPYRPRLLAVARSLNVADPDDLVQATLEIAIRKASGLRDKQALWAWLVAIETHEAFRWTRRLRTRMRLLSDLGGHELDLEESIALRDCPETPPASNPGGCCVATHGATVGPRAAQALGTSENTVKAQRKAGLRSLRETLQ